MQPKTLYDKIWESHVVVPETDAPAILFVDLHLIHEVTSPQAFDELRKRGSARAASGSDTGHRGSFHSHNDARAVAHAGSRSLRSGRRSSTRTARSLVFSFTGLEATSRASFTSSVRNSESRSRERRSSAATATRPRTARLALSLLVSAQPKWDYVLASQCLLQRKAKNFEIAVIPER